jgi:TetR/AcrR family transcriptional repressor of nem operon
MTRPNTREKIIESALTLMQTQGYANTSIDEIVERAGVAKGSLYHAFKSKEALTVAVLDQFYRAAFALLQDGDYVEITEPKARFLGFIDHIVKNGDKFWAHGCMLGSLATVEGDTSTAVTEHTGQLFREMARAISRNQIQPALEASDKRNLPDALALADHLLAVIEGSIVLARARRDLGLIGQQVRHYKAYVQQLLG